MDLKELLSFLKKKWQTVALFTLAFATFAFIFSVAQPQKFRSEQRFLVVSKYAEDVDPYAATRSTEYLTNLLSEVVYSQNFLNSVIDSGYALGEDIFPELPKERKKAWKKSIKTRVIGDTGILDITVYHKKRFVTEQLALAVGEVLRTEHGNYHSRGSAVTIQIIDEPITSLRPVQPNILLNTSVGLILGLISGLAFIYLFPKKEFHFIIRKQKLTEAGSPDWSNPIAIPGNVVVELDEAIEEKHLDNLSEETQSEKPEFMYEASDLKSPSRKGLQDLGPLPYMNIEPPENLPVA